MDLLKDKEVKSYEYISRYSSFPFYYNTQDDKYIYGITSQLKNEAVYVAHKVKQDDTLDKLANHYYGRPDLYWIIADFNHIQDPFIELFGKYDVLKVPSLTSISYYRQ